MKIELNQRACLLKIALAALLVLFGAPHLLSAQTWKAPPAADQKKNPLTSHDPAAMEAAKAIYKKECASCHGKKGKGDGPSSVTLGKPVGDMTSAAAQAQSDGALFWKTAEGRKPMPSFKKKLTEEQIWQIVHFIRTLK